MGGRLSLNPGNSREQHAPGTSDEPAWENPRCANSQRLFRQCVASWPLPQESPSSYSFAVANLRVRGRAVANRGNGVVNRGRRKRSPHAASGLMWFSTQRWAVCRMRCSILEVAITALAERAATHSMSDTSRGRPRLTALLQPTLGVHSATPDVQGAIGLPACMCER
jgi:hypothetical protein